MVQRHRTVAHLIEAVAVHVAYHQRVVALSTIVRAALVVAVEVPAAAQLAGLEVPGLHHGLGVDAAADEDARHVVVAAHDAHADAVGALPVAVAPGLAARAGGNVVGAVQTAARLAVDDAQEFCHAVAVIGREGAVVGAAVVVLVAYRLAVGKDGALAESQSHLAAAVAVEVVDGKAAAVARLNVGSREDAPQQRAVQLVSLPDDGVGHLSAVVVRESVVHQQKVCRAGAALQHQLHLAVAVQVAVAAVVHLIDEARRCSLPRLQSHADVGHTGLQLPGRDGVGVEHLRLTRVAQLVGDILSKVGVRVLIARAGHDGSAGVHLRARAALRLAVEVEARLVGVAGQHAPGHENLAQRGFILSIAGGVDAVGVGIDTGPEAALLEEGVRAGGLGHGWCQQHGQQPAKD